MRQYKYLLQEGKDYHIKQPLGLAVIFLVLWVIIGFALVFYSDFVKTGWTILAVIASFIVLSRTTHKSSKKIVLENGVPERIEFKFASFRPPLVYRIADIQGLTIRKIYCVGIPISVKLLAELEVDGKPKILSLSQSLGINMIQELYTEIDDLLKMARPKAY